MASRGLGQLTLDLVVRMGGFEQGMNKAARITDSRLRAMEKRASAFGKALGVSLGISVAGALAGITAGVKNAIDNMDQLRDASIRLGIGVETLSALRYAAQQTGTDFDTLGKGLKIFAKNAADALDPKSSKAQIFEALGIQVTDATGKLKDLEVLLPEVADKYQQLADGTAKAALSQELFGKSGIELTEFLNQGSSGLKAMTERARELGVVVGQDAADKADKFNDKVNDLKSALNGLANQVAGALLDDLSELTDWAVKFASDGDNAANTAREIASSIRDIAKALNAVGSFLGGLDKFKNKLTEIQGVLIEIAPLTHLRRGLQETLGFNDDWSRGPQPQMRNGPIPATPLDNAFNVPGLSPQTRFDATAPRFSAVGTGNSQIDEARLAAALAGVNKPKPGGGGGGGGSRELSDMNREAEQLNAAYESMNASLSEQIALFGQDGEAARLRYELEHGELSKLDPLKKQELLDRAETLDLMRAEQEESRKSAEMAQREADEKLRGIEATNALIDDMRFELDLLGMTNKEREKAIALRYADADATDAQRAAVADLSDRLYEAHEQREFFEELEHDLSDAFYDFATGAKSAGDAAKDFFDSIAQYILRSISENWAEKIANIFMKSTSSSSSGGGEGAGFWASMIGALFGGGKASGGGVNAGMFYRVNENGPELLSVGGRDYLMMGSQSGHVTPNAAMGGAFNQTIVNNYREPYDARVEAQKAQKTAFFANQVLARNR